MDEEINEVINLTKPGKEIESIEHPTDNTKENVVNGNKREETKEQTRESMESNADEGIHTEDVAETANSEIQAEESDELLKETRKSEEESILEQNVDVVANHEQNRHDVRNHHEDAGAAERLINNSHKEFLQVPTRRSTKKKRKDVHINLESTISDTSKSSTDFSDTDRDQNSRKFSDRMYERSGTCTNCRKSRACCIFIYFWIILFFLCSILAIIVVVFKVLLPYLDALSFEETICEGFETTYTKQRNTCSCGKSCKSDYPCLAIQVTFEDGNKEYIAYFSDNEASIRGKVRTVIP